MLCDACEHARFPNATSAAAKRIKIGRGKKDNAATPETGCVPSAVDTVTDTAVPIAMAAQPSSGADSRSIVVNELQTYVAYCRNRANGEELRHVILSFYTSTDIHEAKDIVVNEFRASIGVSPMLTERRDSTARPAHEAELDDIIGLLALLDEQGRLRGTQFVAADMERLPKFGPEELNVGAVVLRQQKLDAIIETLSTEIEQLKQGTIHDASHDVAKHEVFESAVTEIQKRMDVFHTSINARIDYLNSICTQLSTSVNRSVAENVTHEDIDRSSNIIIFGVAENREISVWRNCIDDILKFIVGRERCWCS